MSRLFHPDIPFRPAKWPFFYGWWMVGMSAFGLLMSAPGQTAGVSPFTEDLMAACGLTRLQLATAYALGTTLSGVCIPFAGNVVDRWGARRMLCIGLVLMSATTSILSLVVPLSSFLHHRLGLTFPQAGMVILVPGFLLLRFSGQGLMTLCCNLTTGHWFESRRGLASAVISAVLSLSMNLMPLALVFLIDATGWQQAWRWMALFHILVVLPFIWVFWRDEPEPCGLSPDGKRSAHTRDTHPSTSPRAWTRGKALKTAAFWVPTLSISMGGLIITAVTFHLLDIGEQVGLDRQGAMAFLIPFGMTTMILSPLNGWLADRLSVRPFLFLQIFAFLTHLSLMPSLGTGWRFFLPAVTLGMAISSMGAISITVYPRFFGRKHLGKITSVQWSCTVIASAIGPALYAVSRQRTGSYHSAMYALLGFCICLLAGACFVRDPNGPANPVTREG